MLCFKHYSNPINFVTFVGLSCLAFYSSTYHTQLLYYYIGKCVLIKHTDFTNKPLHFVPDRWMLDPWFFIEYINSNQLRHQCMVLMQAEELIKQRLFSIHTRLPSHRGMICDDHRQRIAFVYLGTLRTMFA